MSVPLVVGTFLARARDIYPHRQLISRRRNGTHTTTYAEVGERVARLQTALAEMGVREGDVVATLCSNDSRHLEIWFAVMGIGATVHTLNPRLSGADISFVASDGGAKLAFVDEEFLSISQSLEWSFEKVIAVGDETSPYEELISKHGERDASEPDELAAALICHTSGTSDRPKGVVMSHRAIFLHTLVHGHTDVHGISERDTVLPIVPMFHAAAWGIPFASTLAGATQIFSGYAPKADDLVDLIKEHAVTYTAGVPFVFQEIQRSRRLEELKTVRRVCMGGYPAPSSLVSALVAGGIECQQGYGMTEAGPLIARTHVKKEHVDDAARSSEILLRSCLPVPGMQLRVVSESLEDVISDGETVGEVLIRAPWVAGSYLGGEVHPNGWLATGDLAVRDADGYLTIVDRSKDLIKSGGEWISSVALESAIRGCDGVQEVAVVAVADVTWGERPWAFVVGAATLTAAALETVMRETIVSWQIPDRFEFVDDLPRTSVGKIDKAALRSECERLKNAN